MSISHPDDNAMEQISVLPQPALTTSVFARLGDRASAEEPWEEEDDPGQLSDEEPGELWVEMEQHEVWEETEQEGHMDEMEQDEPREMDDTGLGHTEDTIWDERPHRIWDDGLDERHDGGSEEASSNRERTPPARRSRLQLRSRSPRERQCVRAPKHCSPVFARLR